MGKRLPNQGSLETSGTLTVLPSLLVGDHIERLAKPPLCLLGASAITRVER